jgi:hypothetical protein
MIRGALRTLFVAGFASAGLLVAIAFIDSIWQDFRDYQDGMMYE